MDKEDNFKYDIAFNHICSLIEGKRNLNGNSKVYIGFAREYFADIKGSLESMASLGRCESYLITSNLKQVLDSLGKNGLNLSKWSIGQLNEQIFSLDSNLDSLKKHPFQFYRTKDSQEILNFLKNLIPYLQPESRIMTCCGEDVGKND